MEYQRVYGFARGRGPNDPFGPGYFDPHYIEQQETEVTEPLQETNDLAEERPIEQAKPLSPTLAAPEPPAPRRKPIRSDAATELERHTRKCQICRHPDRELIERDYYDWCRPSEIARLHKIDDWSLYRHLKATGLLSRRRENLRGLLDGILERGAEKPISGNTILRAVRAYCSLTDDNRWVEPARAVVHGNESEPKGGA